MRGSREDGENVARRRWMRLDRDKRPYGVAAEEIRGKMGRMPMW